MVLVIGADSPRQPQPGSVGTVHSACDCMALIARIEGYYVQFTGGRASCYFRRQLRKLDPPAEDEKHRETERPRTTEVA